MGWLVRNTLSEKKRHRLIEDAQEVLHPGETILDATEGMVEVPDSHDRAGTLGVTNQRVFFQTKHSGQSEVKDFPFDRLSRCEYSANSNCGTIELVTRNETIRVSQVFKGEGERIVPLIQSHSARGSQPELRTAITKHDRLGPGS
jgi:hypothetical protein